MAFAVDFTDPGLEAAVRDAIPKPTGPILDTDLVGLTDLDASGRGITDLGGLQYCHDLRNLVLASNDITDIWELLFLTDLTELDLGWNPCRR
jgi:hypothetical protein